MSPRVRAAVRDGKETVVARVTPSIEHGGRHGVEVVVGSTGEIVAWVDAVYATAEAAGARARDLAAEIRAVCRAERET